MIISIMPLKSKQTFIKFNFFLLICTINLDKIQLTLKVDSVFTSFHVINEKISLEIYKEYPDLKKEFEDMMDEKCSKEKNEK